jgi:pyruvate kinase
MPRSTKIVATLGPASNDPQILQRMIAAGVDVIRFNFSHGGDEADRLARASAVREAARRAGREVGILVDLQGPKIRVGRFAGGKVQLKAGARFILDPGCTLGNEQRAGIDYQELPSDVRAGDVLLLNDGMIIVDVERVIGQEIHTVVRSGGELADKKGINKQGGGLSASALTERDAEDIEVAMKCRADFIAVSFVRSRADVELARRLAARAGASHGVEPLIIAKIERVEAISSLDGIIAAADGVMVARGDLAVEVGNARVPALQKRIITAARKANKLAITATQMMESMIQNAMPTRAEVSDVANAVLDGTDAVMLSAETAVGRYPVETIEATAAIVAEADRSEQVELDLQFLNQTFSRVNQSISYGALFTAYHLRCAAICTLTESGQTTLWMSRHDVDIPIYALTPSESTQRRLALYRNVHPVYMGRTNDRDGALRAAERILLEQGAVRRGDLLVLTFGEPMGAPGGTNTLKIVRVGEHASAH